MARTFLLLSVAAILITVAGSHEYLLAKGGRFKECVGDPPVCGEGERFSRKDCKCVPRGAQKELVCHLEEVEILDGEGGVIGVEIVGTVINVSVESAHIRKLKHGDCAADGATAGTSCECAEPTLE